MNIINVIKEELNLLNQGVADKYAEKQFNIPDPNKEMNAKAISGIPPEENSNSMGELMGVMKENVDVNIYLNPKSLQEFDNSVKAISTKDGDLFVAQMDGSFYHVDIFNAVNDLKKYEQPLYSAYDENENVTWHRINKTNDFGFSVSYKTFGENVNNWSIVKPMLDAVKRKNINFNFIPRYWQLIKQQRYDDTHEINNNDLNNYSESLELKNYNNSILTELEYNLNEHLNENLNKDDYRGSHQAPTLDSEDSPMYDVTNTFGEDIYSSQALRHFGHRPYDQYSIVLIQSARNKPNMQVKIYRAVPKTITNIEKINDYQKRMKYILKTGKLPNDVDN